MRALGIQERYSFSPNPLHVLNGMLFFEEQELFEASPAYFSRGKLPVKYIESATNLKRFFKFLDDAKLSANDKALLQLWCGFLLLGDNSNHKIMMFVGAAGSGKSTLMDLIEMVLGYDAIASLNIERLDDRFELGSFYEKRLLVAKDVSSDALNSRAAHMLKALSGDSLIKAEIKHQNRRVALKGPFNICITSNSDLFIKLQGDADAWGRRLLILKFSKEPDRPVEYNLADTMFKEEGSAILNWMILGAIRARNILASKGKEKFPDTEEQKARVRELLRLSDSVRAFVRDALKEDPSGGVSTEDLHHAYENYCARNRVLPGPRGAFERELVLRIQEICNGEKGFINKADDNRPCRGYRGVSFKAAKPKTEDDHTPIF